jgi:HK97 gp10 family phage protein
VARKSGGGATVVLTGVKEIDRALRQLERKMAAKVVRQAINKALKPIEARVKELAPVESGQLRDSLKVRAMPYKKGRIAFEVRTAKGDFKGDQFYGAFQEYGTSRQPARPYMRPTYDQLGPEAIAEAERILLEGARRELRAAGWRGALDRATATAAKRTKGIRKRSAKAAKGLRKSARRASKAARKSASRQAKSLRKRVKGSFKRGRSRPRKRR